jgi:DNA-binding NtrC family response regulator
MPTPAHHVRILVIEDEDMIADDLQHELETLGALMIGPAATVAMALRLLDAASIGDGAILDIELHGEKSFPVANALGERGIPFVFTTGYDPSVVHESYSSVPRFEKPVSIKTWSGRCWAESLIQPPASAGILTTNRRYAAV